MFLACKDMKKFVEKRFVHKLFVILCYRNPNIYAKTSLLPALCFAFFRIGFGSFESSFPDLRGFERTDGSWYIAAKIFVAQRYRRK